ncbi:MAG: 23S rRNA (uracil(1939)-C(5))-methyltransferase RlmD [Spirochaetales bacterium]|nr:23S rRNA (uracil(1939)-C(5))-methyltransferase RlmD [Spirochaetales bacterium]
MNYEVKLEKLAGKGKALAWHHGKVVFVPFGVPGDEIEIETTKETKSYDEAIIKRMITQSPYRVEPPCAYFTSCGGCDHQNIEYSRLLTFKKELLAEVYRNFIKNGLTLEEIHPSPLPYGYRNKIHLHGYQNKIFQVWGFYHYENKKIVNIESCPIAHDLVNKAFQLVLNFLKQRFFQFFLMVNEIIIQVDAENTAAMVTLISSKVLDPPKSLYEKMKTILPELSSLYLYHRKNKKGYLFKTAVDDSLENLKDLKLLGGNLLPIEFANLKLNISPLSFFQVNKAVSETIVKHLENELTRLSTKPVLVDLFSGVGALSLPLAEHCEMIHGVELVRHAAELAEANARNNSIPNFTIHQGDAFEAFNRLLQIINSQAKVLLIDPPRQGLDRELSIRIGAGDFQKVLYLSCHPHAQVRDLEIIMARGKFRITKIQAFDMFPQTHHTEVLVVLERV